jgi:hypothetical protein
MLTLKRRRKRRVPPQRGRGEISGPFFCFAQGSISAVAVSTGSAMSCGCDDPAQRLAPPHQVHVVLIQSTQ